MASTQQHRCVFVGNIPYDATEEQLIQICEEVGPVVSFRLVVDRETGKPKGYGFCEYKDEETALSARRNLQGYEINGRQLRVDFAENDKGADRNRDQGRGVPGTSVNDPQRKQPTGQANAGDQNAQQAIGASSAMAAASLMAGALGVPQNCGNVSQTNLHNQPVLGQDPLTLHLAKMSRRQLTKVISDMKLLSNQNKKIARQLLLLCPELLKALFQAQIILGMVTPQMLQMPNIRQASITNLGSVTQGGQVGQPRTSTSFTGLPPLAPVSSSLVQNPILPSVHLPVHSIPHAPVVTQTVAARQSNPSIQLLEQTCAGPQIGTANSSVQTSQPPFLQHANSSVQTSQPPFLQHSVPMGSEFPGRGTQLPVSKVDPSSSLSSQQPLSDPGFQVNALILLQPENAIVQIDRSAYPGNVDTRPEIGMSSRVGEGNFAHKVQSNFNIPHFPSYRNDHISPPAKVAKLVDGTGIPYSMAKATFPTVTSVGQSVVVGSTVLNQSNNGKQPENLDKQLRQVEIRPDIESALLQQVLNLTPEQLRSLAPEQQQQVIQLQQMLR
ncbi:Cleavage stimulating factor 64-like protein [Drosera capensis]